MKVCQRYNLTLLFQFRNHIFQRIAVTLSGPTTSAVTASYTVTGTATGGTDYTLATEL